MLSELECGICYQTYNAGRRCPRELHCKHSFCESCLRALTRPLEAGDPRQGTDMSIDCPLCRHPTHFSGDGDVKIKLRVAESTLEQLMTAGVLDREEEELDEDLQDQEAEVTQTPAEESDSSAGVRSRRLPRSLKKVWRAIIGKRSPQRGDCITSDEMCVAMMSCFMF